MQTSTEVKRIVSEKVGHFWKKMARGLGLIEGRIEMILEEENDKHEECCYKVLQRWCEETGKEKATIRKVMIALTRIGLADINNDIINCLKLRCPAQMDS